MADTAFTTATATHSWVSPEQLAMISRAEQEQRLEDIDLVESTRLCLQARIQSDSPLPAWEREHLGRMSPATTEPKRGGLLGYLPRELQPRKVKLRCQCQSYMNLLSKRFGKMALESPDEAALWLACRTALPTQDCTESSTLSVDDTDFLRICWTQFSQQDEVEMSVLLSESVDDEASMAASVALPDVPSEEDLWPASDSHDMSDEPVNSSSSSSTQARSTTPDTDVSSLSHSTGLGPTKSESGPYNDVASDGEAFRGLLFEIELPKMALTTTWTASSMTRMRLR